MALRILEAMVVMVAMVVGTMAKEQAEEPILPDIWVVVENSYETNVMVTLPDLEVGVSMLVDELYDITEEQGVLTTTDHGHVVKTNYYSKSTQAFVTEGEICEVGGLTGHAGYHFWGWHYLSEDLDGKKNFLYGPSALLRIPRDYSREVEYKGTVEIRDIQANHWSLITRDNYTLDYYFSVEEWTMPYGHVLDGISLKAPLQVKVHGLQGDPWHTDKPNFIQSIYYDFIQFIPHVAANKWKQFLVPRGIACEDRVTLDPDQLDPPTAPQKFQVFVETVVDRKEHGGTMIFRSWVYYDANVQLLRIDVNPDNDIEQSRSSYKSIHDYNTGIGYEIDSFTGECKMKVLEPGQFGNSVGGSEIGDIIMANPDSLFHLDDKYIFSGYDETRGIKTTRWTAIRDDIAKPEQPGEYFKKSVVDYQFLDPTTTDVGEQKGRPFPVRLDIKIFLDDSPSVFLDATVNLLHMRTSFDTGHDNPFDVRECMDTPAQRAWYKITYKGHWREGAAQKPDEFAKIVADQISAGTDASPVRIADVQLEHDEELVWAMVLVLEPAPYHLQFKQMKDRKPTERDTAVGMAIVDDDICAAQCLMYEKFQCKSFYQCTGLGRNCYVSNYANSEGKPIHVNKDCRHYKKAIIKNTPFQIPNWKVKDWIDTEIQGNRLHIQLEYEDEAGHPQTGMYQAIYATEELFGDDPISVDILRADLRVAYKQGKLRGSYTDQHLPHVSLALCAETCELQKSFRCESLSYCYDAQQCYLSSHVINTPVPDKEIIADTDCVVLGRQHTDDYEFVDGLVYTGPADAIIEAVDVDKCAYHCTNMSSFTCRSFDYCDSSGPMGLCRLYEKRTLDMDESDLNATAQGCTHFTRNSLVDFEKHPHQVLQGSRDRYFHFVSVSYCASMCEDQPEYGCNGFDYCHTPEDIVCYLTSDHYSDEGVSVGSSGACDHYSREYYDGKDRNAYAHTRSSKYIYGPGDMAGLAVSMLVIAIAGTMAGVYAYNKYLHK